MSKEQMNVPRLRFPEFTELWEEKKLGEICNRVTRKNKNGESELPLTISSQDGLVDQRTFFNKVVAAKDMTNYYLLKRGEFAYNKSYSKGFDYGSIKRLNAYDQGCLSTLYICFGLTDDDVDSDYLEQFFDTLLWYKDISQICAEGARNHGLLNVDTKAFFDCVTIKMPKSITEQSKIASFIGKYDTLISLQQRKLDQIMEYKKGMLQKMFPKEGETMPEVRFPGFTGDWQQRKLGEIANSYSGGTPVAGKEEYYGGSIPFIRSAEVNSDSTELFLTEEGLNKSSAKMVKKGVILYALYGATSGEVGLARLDGAINQAILAIKPRNGFDAPFIMHWLRKSKERIIGTYLQGGQGNLSGAIVTSLMIDFPDYEEQKMIGAFFQNLDTLINLNQRKLDAMREYKKGLLQQMFV